jgi:hypothetical protein
MAYPAVQLISEAFYVSGIVSRGFQTVAGDQVTTGLLVLNEILTDTVVDIGKIPYFTDNYSFHAVAGQEKYFIPGMTQMETLTFYIDSVRFQMQKDQRDYYFGRGRAENTSALPFEWHTELALGGMNLFLYFFPDQNFPMVATGLFSLNTVSLYQDLLGSNVSANLGIFSVSGAGTIGQNELVVNGIDLAGTYATQLALINYINTGIIPNVVASTIGTEFVLTGPRGGMIVISTIGTAAFANNITFSNFSTINGAQNLNFRSTAYDQFYINYLKYALAERLCTNYNFEVPSMVETQLLRYDQLIDKRASAIDMSMYKVSTLSGQNSVNYGQVNFGKGWTAA